MGLFCSSCESKYINSQSYWQMLFSLLLLSSMDLFFLILLWASWPCMLLFLLVFPLLTLIINCPYFIAPFIVSWNPFPLISINITDFFITQVLWLILNLLEANCPLDKSIYSNTLENFLFQYPEYNRDTEANTLWYWKRNLPRQRNMGGRKMMDRTFSIVWCWILMEYDLLLCPFIFFHMINKLWWAVKTKNRRGSDEGNDKMHP